MEASRSPDVDAARERRAARAGHGPHAVGEPVARVHRVDDVVDAEHDALVDGLAALVRLGDEVVEAGLALGGVGDVRAARCGSRA